MISLAAAFCTGSWGEILWRMKFDLEVTGMGDQQDSGAVSENDEREGRGCPILYSAHMHIPEVGTKAEAVGLHWLPLKGILSMPVINVHLQPR